MKFEKDHKPWNKGLKGVHFSPDTEFKKGELVNEKHPGWKGDDVSYLGIHKWIGRHFVRPNSCDHCGTTQAKKYEWANISKEYRRDRDDWFNLCTSCHRKYDDHAVKMWETRRRSVTA